MSRIHFFNYWTEEQDQFQRWLNINTYYNPGDVFILDIAILNFELSITLWRFD